MIPTMHATNEAALARVTAEADANACLIADLLAALKEARFYLTLEGYVARGGADEHAVMVQINAAVARAEAR